MTAKKIRTELSIANKLARGFWGLVWFCLYRPTPRPMHGWRRFLLRLFGASISQGAHPYPAARIYAPWNLTMEADSCLSDHVDCYCVDRIVLGKGSLVSQYTYLCTATHDYNNPAFPTLTAPIHIGANAWVAADAFIGPGITIGEGSIVGARSHVTQDIPPWQVHAGQPTAFLKNREKP